MNETESTILIRLQDAGRDGVTRARLCGVVPADRWDVTEAANGLVRAEAAAFVRYGNTARYYDPDALYLGTTE